MTRPIRWWSAAGRRVVDLLVRDARGPVCYYRGDVLRIPPPPGPTGCPVFDRPDREIVVRGLQARADGG